MSIAPVSIQQNREAEENIAIGYGEGNSAAKGAMTVVNLAKVFLKPNTDASTELGNNYSVAIVFTLTVMQYPNRLSIKNRA